MRPDDIRVDPVENGFVIKACFYTGEFNQYDTALMEQRVYVALNGAALELLISDLRQKPNPFPVRPPKKKDQKENDNARSS